MRTNARGAVALALLVPLATACGPSNYKTTRAVRIAHIQAPSHLADDEECQTLWNDIARYGVGMDDLSEDWNQVVLNSAGLSVDRARMRHYSTSVGLGRQQLLGSAAVAVRPPQLAVDSDP